MSDTGQPRLARLVRERREAAGMTQDDLADAADVQRRTVTSMEDPKRDARRRAATWPQVAKALGWDVSSYARIMAGGDPVTTDPPAGSMYLDPTERAIIASGLNTDDVIQLLDHYRDRRAKQLAARGRRREDRASGG